MADQKARERYNEWLSGLSENDHLRRELLSIKDDDDEIEERFGDEMTFGTAGLRGKLGAGTRYMNRVIISRVTKALANCIIDEFVKNGNEDERERPSCVIAYDPRHFSKDFAFLSARILSRHGITAYTFDGIRPTPELAFLIRYLHADAGINITASHNPKEYNGYKVYWSDGCQISGEVSKRIASEMERLSYPLSDTDDEETREVNRIIVLGENEDRAYLDRIEELAVYSADELDLSMPLVYTPLNGAGAVPFERMLIDRGFDNYHIVEEQKDPDPDFSSVGYPNPEDPKAFKLAETLGMKTEAEVLLATDPDADRFAIELRKPDGSGYLPLNGNQTGYILLEHILSGKTSLNDGLKPAVVRSIVTSPLGDIIAEKHGVAMFEALTGFKNICGTIPVMEQNGYSYVFGWEESVGYAACPDIRDKDGISAGMLVSEAAAYCRKNGKALYGALMDIYERYGFANEEEPFIIKEGLKGKAEIDSMMENLRREPFLEVAGMSVLKVTDYSTPVEIRVGDETSYHLESSNVLRFDLSGNARFFVRPSGTEPKIKFYFYAFGDSIKDAAEKNSAVKEEVLRFFGW
ncbi:MAG: phospho-sugar mutase [Lachnospiraceae bacterium]|nr:phospho-sugar mutase [Lachnospiraceae bacterium]